MDLNSFEQNVTARFVLKPGLVDLQKFMSSDRYHLTASALARVCPSMTGLMLWITTFNHCKTSLLLLVSNAFLKVRPCTLRETILFHVPSNVQQVQQAHHPLARSPPSIS